MHLTVYRDESAFDALSEEWNPLLAQTDTDTVFLTWEWQSTWWSHLGTGELWLLAWRDNEDQLVGLSPLYLDEQDNGERRLTLVGCLEVSDYLDMILLPDHTAVIYAEFLDWITSDEAPSWDLLDFCNLPESSMLHRLLPELATERGLQATTLVEDVCPIIDLPDSWDAYLASLHKKQRHEVRRKLRRAEATGELNWHVVQSPSELDAAMNDFIHLHQLSHSKKHDFMDSDMQTFFRAGARSMLDAGWLQLSFLELDGQRAATMLCFDYKDAIMVYNSGYDPDRFGHISPGIVQLASVIRDAIERGKTIFDFLQGDEVYKYRFGARETKVHRTLVIA